MSDVAERLLKPGAVGVIPTDTVYGIVARAADESAVERIFMEIKPRDRKPGTIVAASIDQLVDLGIKRRYLTAVEQFWPGAISVEIPHSITYLNRGTGRQAFRIPDDPKLLALLEETGPLQTTSANPPDLETAATLQQAKDYFGDKIDFYEDGGDLSGRPPSTVIRIVDDAIEVVREGAVKIDESGRRTE
jgi:L-threonylcarbamoyladenylate synthase